MFRRLPSILAACALALLGGCGGGTSQITPFAPTRIISFGDESSTLLPDGRKYTISGLNPDTKLRDCKLNPVWNQFVASQFGLVFQQCNPDGVAIPTGLMYASAGAKVADVASKIDLHLSNDSFGAKDLVTVMAGMNDILELYNQYPAQDRGSLINDAKARGVQLAQQVNRIANAGGRVLISTIFDLGLTPFASNERLAKSDIDRAVFLDDLSNAFNIAMRLALTNDGRKIGLVLADESIQQAVRFGRSSTVVLADIARPACKAEIAVQECTTDTLVTDADPRTWLWANDHLLSAGGQDIVGNVAFARARNNPF